MSKMQTSQIVMSYGGGDGPTYSQTLLVTEKAYTAMIPDVIKLIGEINYDHSGPFTVCDYGVADGGTSISLMRAIIEAVRKKHGQETEVHIIHEDQPHNDFKTLFCTLHGMKSAKSTYLTEHSGVFITAAGTGFYQQSVPSHSVHLALSSVALHYLREAPCQLSGAIYHRLASVKSEVEAFATQGAKDWNTFLIHRSKELTPGGLMALHVPVVNEAGESTAIRQLSQLNTIWLEMRNQQKITEVEFQRAMYIIYYRTKEELMTPFKDPDSEVSTSGLRLMALSDRIIHCPYNKQWMDERKLLGDQATHRYAESLAALGRFFHQAFLHSLSDARPEEEKQQIVDQIYDRYKEMIMASPEGQGADVVLALVVIKKVKQ